MTTVTRKSGEEVPSIGWKQVGEGKLDSGVSGDSLAPQKDLEPDTGQGLVAWEPR